MTDCAETYFRARALRIDTYDDFNLEWNKDIIYSGHPIEYFAGEPIDMKTKWHVEIIDLANENAVLHSNELASRDEAEILLKEIREDLHNLSRLEFVARYLIHDSDDENQSSIE